MIFQREITIVGSNGEKQAATVSCHEYRTKRGRRREFSIQLRAEGFNLDCTAGDFFEAFCRIREQLAALDFYPLCYGASRNVYPSGMCRDWSSGLTAYKVQIGKVRQEDLVGIFETGPDVEVTTVAAQREFHTEWLNSNPLRRVRLTVATPSDSMVRKVKSWLSHLNFHLHFFS
jgi:hypothetical protein